VGNEHQTRISNGKSRHLKKGEKVDYTVGDVATPINTIGAIRISKRRT